MGLPERAEADRARGGPLAAVLVVAAGLLAIGLTRDWRLLHEDNGAFQTTIALSHLKAGLATTRAHDVLTDRNTGERSVYGHHPPGLGLLLAGAFALAGSAQPAVARTTVILFHLGTLLVLHRTLLLLLGRAGALAGTFFLAVVPMAAYFGRMVNYEPVCLFAVSLQLLGWTAYAGAGGRRWLAVLGLGIVLGALVDWPAFFFALALALVSLPGAIGGDRRARAALAVCVAAGAGMAALDLLHLRWAAGGSLEALSSAVRQNVEAGAGRESLLDLLEMHFDSFRRYYTHAGTVACAAAALAAARPRGRLGAALLPHLDGALVRRFLLATGLAAGGYVAVAPSWSGVHPYWKFYFLPFAAAAVGLALVLLRRLGGRAPRVVLWVLSAELLLASAYQLRLRHTREGAYAIETTARIRAERLRPSDWR